MSNDDGHDRKSSDPKSLSAWIESILFGMNLLMTLLGSVLILRFRKISLEAFGDFGVEMSSITELVLGLPFAGLLPSFGVIAIVVWFLCKDLRKRVLFHVVHFLFIVVTGGIFIGTALPAMHQLIQNLS